MNLGNTKQNGIFVVVSLLLILTLSGCGSTKYTPNTKNQSGPEKITLQEGDVIKITFPDAGNLNTTTKIQRDGTIKLPAIGELHVAGMTSGELEKVLLAKYADQIVSKEINVSLESSTFQIYVTGEVMHPGKLVSDRPMTVVEAILESGGVDFSRANLKGVIITRKTKEHTEAFKVDVQSMMNGKSDETFDLRPNDVVFVPEKFSWY